MIKTNCSSQSAWWKRLVDGRRMVGIFISIHFSLQVRRTRDDMVCLSFWYRYPWPFHCLSGIRMVYSFLTVHVFVCCFLMSRVWILFDVESVDSGSNELNPIRYNKYLGTHNFFRRRCSALISGCSVSLACRPACCVRSLATVLYCTVGYRYCTVSTCSAAAAWQRDKLFLLLFLILPAGGFVLRYEFCDWFCMTWQDFVPWLNWLTQTREMHDWMNEWINQSIIIKSTDNQEERTCKLAEVCYKRTQGNPFFLLSFLHLLQSESYLKFNLTTLRAGHVVL